MSKPLSLTDRLAQPEDQGRWTVEGISDELGQHLMREARQAQRLIKSAKITLNPIQIRRMQQNLDLLEEKWAFFEPRANFLAEHNQLHDDLSFALESFEQSLQQLAQAVHNSNSLTELRQQAALKIEELQFEIEALEQEDSHLSTTEMDHLLSHFFAEYEALAEAFETLEEYGLNIKTLMQFYDELSQKLDDLQQLVQKLEVASGS